MANQAGERSANCRTHPELRDAKVRLQWDAEAALVDKTKVAARATDDLCTRIPGRRLASLPRSASRWRPDRPSPIRP